jgi:hypothetical protein
MIPYRFVLPLLLATTLWGCTSLPADTRSPLMKAAADSPALPAGEGWWYASFHFAWSEAEEIAWYKGTMIGGEVIAPVFDEYARDILVWRVHRRAARDGNGHVFSFIFFSTPAGAQRIYTAIQTNPLVVSMLADGRLHSLGVDDVRSVTRPNIEDTSDARWPLLVQQTWPALIMGVSRMWLDQVSELAAQESAAGGLDDKYKKVQASITELWMQQGQHAMLHHLNAVYAYQPILMRY